MGTSSAPSRRCSRLTQQHAQAALLRCVNGTQCRRNQVLQLPIYDCQQ